MFLLEKINISSVQKYLGINVLRTAHPGNGRKELFTSKTEEFWLNNC